MPCRRRLWLKLSPFDLEIYLPFSQQSVFPNCGGLCDGSEDMSGEKRGSEPHERPRIFTRRPALITEDATKMCWKDVLLFNGAHRLMTGRYLGISRQDTGPFYTREYSDAFIQNYTRTVAVCARAALPWGFRELLSVPRTRFVIHHSILRLF